MRKIVVLLLTFSLVIGGIVGCDDVAGTPTSSIRGTQSGTKATSPRPSSTPGEKTGTLQVHFVDVGQGDAILIITPDGKTALIDGGEADSGIVEYLQKVGIKKLDLMVATHPHSDHIGGLVPVLETISTARVASSGQEHTSGTYEKFLDAVAAAKARYVEVKRGKTLSVGDVELQVLSPVNNNAENLNNDSLVLRLVYGKVAFLFMGDAEKLVEADILAAGLKVQANILKVGHHASRSASSPEFLAKVKPDVAIYTAGQGNKFGHPHAETLAALKAVKAKIYGTDTQGTIIVTTDGNTYRVKGNQ